jgi:hypothetical protein
MNKQTKAILLSIVLATGLLISCAETNPHPMDMSLAIQNAKTSADHEALAAHYEQAAKDADTKVEEHKKIFADYQSHRYLWGRQSQMMENHCESIIHQYEKIAESNKEMAKMHREIANGITQ